MGAALGSPTASFAGHYSSITVWTETYSPRGCRRELAGIVREVWGSTRGTPKPCRWFMEFVERQALRCYRMVVLGWTPLSQKPVPRPDTHPPNTQKQLVRLRSLVCSVFQTIEAIPNSQYLFHYESPLKPKRVNAFLGGALYMTESQDNHWLGSFRLSVVTLEPTASGDQKKYLYVPLQTIEHAWAGISGMLRYPGLEGHSRPEALNLEAWNHAQGLT